MHTTTFCHPRGPQTFDLPLSHKCVIFLMTLNKEKQNKKVNLRHKTHVMTKNRQKRSKVITRKKTGAGERKIPDLRNPDSRIHCPEKEDLIFVVHGHNDEELRTTSEEVWSESILGRHELIWIARRSCVPHFRRFLRFLATDDMGWYGDVENEIALLKLDLSDGLLKIIQWQLLVRIDRTEEKN